MAPSFSFYTIIRARPAVNVPPTQEEADTLMLKELENTFDELLLSIKKHIKKLDANQTTYDEAVQSFNDGLYTSCALDIFALIDHLFITSQIETVDSKKRKLAKEAVKNKFEESKGAPYLVIAVSAKTIIEDLFKYGGDFDPEIEGKGNRNFISHGMNKKIPDRTFCLKLFVLLYNLCLLFTSGIFSREGDSD